MRATRATPLPREEPGLDALLGAWERFEDECRLLAWEEETIGLAGGWDAAATSRWVEVRDAIGPFLEEADASIRRLEAAKRALVLVKRGEELERSGDLPRALATYRRARFESPDYEAAADGEFRVSRRFTTISTRAAREAMNALKKLEADWALETLLLGLGPEIRHHLVAGETLLAGGGEQGEDRQSPGLRSRTA